MKRLRLLSLFFLLGLLPARAEAAASTTVGEACSGNLSRVDWDAIYQCVNSLWARAPFWLGTSTDTCDAAHTGMMQWSGSVFQGCNGTSWGSLSPTSTSSGASAFAFTDQTNVATATETTSDTVTLSGFTGALPAACASGCTALARNGTWLGTNGFFLAGDTLAIKQTSASTEGTATTATVAVGSTTSSPWTITTKDSYTKLLLHMNGTDGSTSFTDSSTVGNTVTATNATVSTAQSQFGGASALFTGSASYLSVPNSTNWDFGSGNFTIDAWVYFKGFSSSSYQYFYSQAIVNSTHIQFGYNNSAGLDYEDSVGCTFTQGSTSGWSTGTWYHVALVRNGTTMTMYRNGIALATKTCSVALPSVGTEAYIGAALPGYHYLNGYIDELRVSKGIARWTAGFTPPTTAY